MEFYDKLLEEIPGPVKSEESCCQQGQGLRKCFEEYDAVTLIMLYLKVLHDMVPKNSEINS